MQGTEHLFGREEAIRNQPQEERRDDGSDGIYGIRPVCKVDHALRRHIVADRDVPRTPYKKLEEHHCAESRRGRVEHYSCLWLSCTPCPSSNKWNRRSGLLVESFVPHGHVTQRIIDNATDVSQYFFS